MPVDVELRDTIVQVISPGIYTMKFPILFADLVWERVYSRSTNTWLMATAIVLMMNAAIEVSKTQVSFPGGVMSTTILYLFYFFCAAVGATIVVPLMLVNGPSREKNVFEKTALLLFPFLSMGTFFYLWLVVDEDPLNLVPIALWFTGICCSLGSLNFAIRDFIYGTEKRSHLYKHEQTNQQYVTQLLHRRESSKHTHERPLVYHGYIHPLFVRAEANDSLICNSTSVCPRAADIFVVPAASIAASSEASLAALAFTPPKETTIEEHLAAHTGKELWDDIRRNTPHIMRLGFVLGMLSIVVFMSYSLDLWTIRIGWAKIQDTFYDTNSTSIASSSSTWDYKESLSVALTVNNRLLEALSLSVEVNTAISSAGITNQELLSAVTNFQAAAASLYHNHSMLSGWLDKMSADEDENEKRFNEIKQAWNTSIFCCVVVGAVIAVVVLAWPSVMASNIRRNLRMGSWRLNRAAYVNQVKLHIIAGVPGAFIGISVVAVIIIPVILALFVFCFAYSPLRVYLYNEWGSYLYAGVIGYAFLFFIQEYLFGTLQTYSDGSVKNLQSYSLFFAVMVFFHFLYGSVKAVFRFGMYVCYMLFAVLRMDITVLPIVLRQYDDIYLMFNSLMLYEHQTKNPILRCAVVLLAAGSTDRSIANIRARNRWFLAYTLLNNPFLVNFRKRDLPKVVTERSQSTCRHYSTDSSKGAVMMGTRQSLVEMANLSNDESPSHIESHVTSPILLHVSFPISSADEGTNPEDVMVHHSPV